MKKLTFIFLSSLLFTSCFTYRDAEETILDLSKRYDYSVLTVSSVDCFYHARIEATKKGKKRISQYEFNFMDSADLYLLDSLANN